MTDHFSDEAIVKSVLAGAIEDFEIIVKKYQNKIFSIGIRFFKNQEDALDFTQEVLIKIFEKLKTFKGHSPFKFWLGKVAYNHGVSKFHKKRDENDNIEYDDFLTADQDRLPDVAHEKKEIKKVLVSAVNSLPEKYRICMDLYFFWGFPFSRISEVTGFPVNTIKSNVFRAKQILRDNLRGTIAEDYNE